MSAVVRPGAVREAGAALRRALRRRGAQTARNKPLAAVVFDEAVAGTARAVAASARRAGLRVARIGAPRGEKVKRFSALEKILDALAAEDEGAGCGLIAVGGGALLDAAGLAAALYKRGVPVVYCPTTLLAAVDAAVGGKTGVNLKSGKNLAGVFRSPDRVLVDVRVLSRLPDRIFCQGLAETVKHAFLDSASHVAFLRRNAEAFLARNPRLLARLVARSIRVKEKIVASDPLETRGKREALNWGHTTAHALEALSGYRLAHGDAVAMGMVVAAEVARRRFPGPKAEALAAHLTELLEAFDLPRRVPKRYSAREILAAARLDKKRRTGRVRLTLLEAPGRVRVVDGVPEAEYRAALRAAGAGA